MHRSHKLSSDDELQDLLIAERQNTANWYLRISGQIPWETGERSSFEARFTDFAKAINPLIYKDAVEWFANLPES